MSIEELAALCEERGRAIYEANCHILQLTDSLNAATRERDEARVQLAALATKAFITQLERGEIRHVAYVAGGFYTREAIAEWAKKSLGFERADEIRRLTIPDHKQFPPMAGGGPDEP